MKAGPVVGSIVVAALVVGCSGGKAGTPTRPPVPAGVSTPSTSVPPLPPVGGGPQPTTVPASVATASAALATVDRDLQDLAGQLGTAEQGVQTTEADPTR